METNVLITTEGYIVMRQSETQPIYKIIWIVNVLRIPTILSIKQAYCPIVISVSVFLLLLAACYHIPPFALQHKVECLAIFCHYSFLSAFIPSPNVLLCILRSVHIDSYSNYRFFCHSLRIQTIV